MHLCPQTGVVSHYQNTLQDKPTNISILSIYIYIQGQRRWQTRARHVIIVTISRKQNPIMDLGGVCSQLVRSSAIGNYTTVY
jgi:hypothetical protein